MPTLPVSPRAVPRRVVDSAHFTDAATGERWIDIAFSCGHEMLTNVLPSGFPSTASLADALLGCSQCEPEDSFDCYVCEGEWGTLAELAEHMRRHFAGA